VGDSYLGLRVDHLRRAQNPDGGWGYFPGKQSWLEPTFYAALVLHGDPAADRAWALLSSWQQDQGSWRPAAQVAVSHAGTALCVTMATVRGEYGEPFDKGVAWLLDTEGVESTVKSRVMARIGAIFGVKPDRDLHLTGWPWKPDTASWVEPTAHALVALKKAALKKAALKKAAWKNLLARLHMGEAQLLSVRCNGGGWNYGSPAARGQDLRPYPETTALALLGLQGRSGLGPSLGLAARMLSQTASPLARAWLTIALRVNGAAANAPAASSAPGRAPEDVLITALEALSAPEGNHFLLQTGAVA
jgi:hypothetical protein